MTDTTPARATITDAGWTATVEHAGLMHNSETGSTRNVWRWVITAPQVIGCGVDGCTDWCSEPTTPVWQGADLSSAMDLSDPDPVEALRSLGSFLAAYVEAVEYAERTGREAENAGLFRGLDVEGAQALADAITVEFLD